MTISSSDWGSTGHSRRGHSRLVTAALFLAVACGLGGLSSCASSLTEVEGAITEDGATSTSSTGAGFVQADITAAATAMLADWPGEYGGVPQFQWLKDSLYLAALKPAVERGIELHMAEIDRIATDTTAPTFTNTVGALEASGGALDNALVYWRVWSASESTPEFREVQTTVAPLLAAYNSAISQNQALFKRVAAVQNSAAQKKLTAQEQRLLKQHFDSFARNGATLEGDAAERYADIQNQLADLHTRFSANMLADEEGYVTYLNESQLGGLPSSVVAAAAQAATDRDRDGEWAITNTRSSMDPFLTYSTERGLRETVWRNYYARGDNRGEHDNVPLIAEILQLRHERVQLLGFDNYAKWRLDNRMARTPARAEELMMQLWPAAIAKVKREVADMQAIADEEQASGAAAIKIEPWDYRFYADKVRRSKYALDSNEVMQYLQLDNLVEAMFFVASELFDLKFTPLPVGTLPVANENVRVWEVETVSQGTHVGLWYLDPFARPGKGSGAWASSYRSRSSAAQGFDLGDRTVLVSNNSNFVKAPEGEAVLISWSDAETLFHEFGHALHALVADVDYPGQNWGVRDYTEFQSQLLERWLLTPPVVERYLRHHETDQPIPDSLVAKLKAAATFNQGFATTEYLASAIVDMKLHTIDPTGLDAASFERETLKALNMPSELVMRHRTPHFGHVFESEGYAAGYYGYIWSEVLTADAAEAFAESPGGFYDKEVASRMVKYLFAPRNSIEPMEGYRQFRGRNPEVEALVRARGFDE